MVELCFMASHGYPPGFGFVFHPEQGFSRVPKDLHQIPLYNRSNQDLPSSDSINLCLQQKQEWKPMHDLLDCDHFIRIDSKSERPPLIDIQETHPDSAFFSFAIAEQCARQEEISKLLAAGSIDEEGGLLVSSMLYDLMGSQPSIEDLPQYPFASYSRWCLNPADPQQSLISPTREFYLNQSLLNIGRDISSPKGSIYSADVLLQYNYTGTEMNDMLSFVSDLYLSKNPLKSSKQTMLVPYFERRRRARINVEASKLVTEKVGDLKSHAKMEKKASRKKKNIKERDIYYNSYLHACESILSIIVDSKQQGQAILALKKSGPQVPQLLTQFSASIAGTGIAAVLSVLCRVACSRVPFSVSKLLSTGLGLGLVWLSWGINKLRNTVVTISKSSGKLGDEDEMMQDLDRNLKDIYFRAAALMAVAVLRLA